jgi:hypothetical protein
MAELSRCSSRINPRAEKFRRSCVPTGVRVPQWHLGPSVSLLPGEVKHLARLVVTADAVDKYVATLKPGWELVDVGAYPLRHINPATLVRLGPRAQIPAPIDNLIHIQMLAVPVCPG